jgi:hypothetical protein
VQFVYEMARHIIGMVKKDEPFQWWDVTEDEARTCINECNVDMAQALIERNRTSLTALLLAMPHYDESGTPEAVDKLIDGPIKQGVHTVLVNPDVFSSCWRLDTIKDEHAHTNQWSAIFRNFTLSGRFES